MRSSCLGELHFVSKQYWEIDSIYLSKSYSAFKSRLMQFKDLFYAVDHDHDRVRMADTVFFA